MSHCDSPPAYPPLHLHRWRGHHERPVLGSAGSEEPWCLVSLRHTRGTINFGFNLVLLSVRACLRITAYDQFLHIFFPADGIARTTPSPGTTWSPPSSTRYELLSTSCTNNLFHISLCSSSVAFKMKEYFCEGQAISLLLSCLKVHLVLSHWIYTCVCVCVCFQLFKVNMDYSKLKKNGPDF